MLDHLRIQCPSCGIILDVKNSRHEAVKQIVCPNCKKQLAVNFEEELEPAAPPQPIEPLYYGEMRIDLNEGVNKISLPNCDKVEIKVVRLKDGNSKCLVRPLSDTPVIVNRQQLLADEQVALSKGDYLEIGKTVLRAGEPGTINPEPPTPPTQIAPKPKKPKKDRSYVWLNTAIAFVILMGATIYLWPSQTDTGKDLPNPGEVIAQVADSMEKKPSDNVVKPKKDTVRHPVVPPKPEVKAKDYSKMSDYDLEKLSSQDDAEAQYTIGVRLIKKGGISNVIRGINYLKAASNNNFSKARVALDKAINSLQNKANNGDSISYYILKKI